MLSVKGIAKKFGGNTAVNHISFELGEGEMLALIGPNGAGKSTTFNMINGQTRPDFGDISLNNQSLIGLTAKNTWKLGISRTFQVAATFQTLTLAENIQMALLSTDGQLFSLWRRANDYRRDDAMNLLHMVGLDKLAHQASSNLAYGDVKRLELALAMANDPKILLMDEPTAGMAPAERRSLMALIRELVQHRKLTGGHSLSVLFTEHSMDVVFDFADRIIVMAGGNLIAQGTTEMIKSNQRVQEVYFGGGRQFGIKYNE
jgi:branched-chain amino acid transport system ATP-binding protein